MFGRIHKSALRDKVNKNKEIPQAELHIYFLPQITQIFILSATSAGEA